jgi:hypothetical protein
MGLPPVYGRITILIDGISINYILYLLIVWSYGGAVCILVVSWLVCLALSISIDLSTPSSLTRLFHFPEVLGAFTERE